jgi:hypothetical protein
VTLTMRLNPGVGAEGSPAHIEVLANGVSVDRLVLTSDSARIGTYVVTAPAAVTHRGRNRIEFLSEPGRPESFCFWYMTVTQADPRGF